MVAIKYIPLAICLLMATSTYSAPTWLIDKTKSSLTFVATQNNAPVKGHFKTFTADIQFDETNLKDSRIKVLVDINSISTSYPELTSTLLSSEWFNPKRFPKAIFTATNITETGKHQYTADGSLTIKDKSSPISLMFSANLPEPDAAEVTGKTTVKRSIFNVGEGEWQSTEEVKDDVEVTFNLIAKKVST